jgi:hypothetical protein
MSKHNSRTKTVDAEPIRLEAAKQRQHEAGSELLRPGDLCRKATGRMGAFGWG